MPTNSLVVHLESLPLLPDVSLSFPTTCHPAHCNRLIPFLNNPSHPSGYHSMYVFPAVSINIRFLTLNTYPSLLLIRPLQLIKVCISGLPWISLSEPTYPVARYIVNCLKFYPLQSDTSSPFSTNHDHPAYCNNSWRLYLLSAFKLHAFPSNPESVLTSTVKGTIAFPADINDNPLC